MKMRLVAGIAVVAAAFAGLGYVAGTASPLAGGALVGPALAQDATFSEAQRGEIETVIRNYLMTNPEIIRDAIIALQQKESAAAEEAQSAAFAALVAENGDLLFDSSRQVVLGNPQGDVTLVEFFDYNCGYCRRAHADMKRLIEDDPGLRIVLKEYPVLGEGSVQAAQIASAVLLTAPEKYAEFHDAMMGEPGQLDGPTALAVAQDLGLEPEVLLAAAQGNEAADIIAEAASLGERLQLTGTPSYVSKRKVIVGAVGFDALKQEVAAVRACNEDAANC